MFTESVYGLYVLRAAVSAPIAFLTLLKFIRFILLLSIVHLLFGKIND